MMQKRWSLRFLEETIFKWFMRFSFGIIAGSLVFILITVVAKGLPYLNLAMLTKASTAGYYQGKEGGLLNAILGSLYLAGGGTLLALILSLPVALYLEVYASGSRWSMGVRLVMDVLWGIPSIVYGAFGFSIMLVLGMRASLLWGMLTLAFVELPILTRAMDEVIRLVPFELKETAFAMGSTRLETAIKVLLRQSVPGLFTGILLAFGRGIGDAAAVLFTAGYTDRLPASLFRPAASLPLAVFFQLNTPYPEVRGRAYAAALILTALILAVSLVSRWMSGRLSRNILK